MVSSRWSLKLVLSLYYQVASLFAFSRFLKRFCVLGPGLGLSGHATDEGNDDDDDDDTNL